jgi:hypothetical protein
MLPMCAQAGAGSAVGSAAMLSCSQALAGPAQFHGDPPASAGTTRLTPKSYLELLLLV